MKAVLVDDEKTGLDYLTQLCENIPELTDIKGFTKSRSALDRKSTRLNSSHGAKSRIPSSA